MSRWVLHALLTMLGAFLARASRHNAYRRALSRPRSIAVESDDGVTYRFAVQDRRFRTERGATAEADFRLRAASARDALRVLIARDPLDRILTGIGSGSVSMKGDPMLFVWFQGRMEEALPFASKRKRRQRFPGAYTTPRDDIEAARWIRREPPEDVLDANWAPAIRQRAKLLMMRVAAGEDPPAF